MLPDFAQLEEIFTAAVLKTDPAERAAYLDDACAGDAELRHRIEDLLSADADSATFLPLPKEGTTAIFTPVSERPGSVIGRYKLLEQIGEGGFGVVFMAEQEQPVRRRVALKIIKAGMDTRQVVARFEAERQALALMDHPNIARVFDGGATETGRPYFVMELVRGVPITEYCDAARLTTNERLALFQEVCGALQHAHQKGIIHRDLKPSNVLVTMHDDKAVPKVIDFGVAKATQGRLTDRTLFTEFRSMIGTPNYMSPEQALMSGLDVDTRSDVYSLGVLLYELLTGSTPIDTKRIHQATYDDLRRLICEEEPPRPSARLSALSAERRTTLARQRHCEPAQLAVELRSELDWIVMKCLEKDRNRRYETANGLAMDINRYLNDEPVLACPPARTYRLKKFLRRNKVGVMAGSAIFMALALGVALATIGFLQARREAIRADHEADAARAQTKIAVAEATKAKAISDLLLEALQSANPDKARGTDYTVRQLLDEISAGLKDQFNDKPEVEATLHATIGNAYRRLDKLDKAGPHLKAALELRRSHFGSISPEVADSIADYTWYLSELGELQRAEATIHEAVAIHRKLGLPDDLAVKVLEASAFAIWTKPDKYRELEQLVEQIRAIASRSPDRYPQLATVMHWLAAATSDPVKGARLARESVVLHRRLHGENHPETAYGICTLGDKLDGQFKFDEAEACYREGLAIFRRNFDDGQTPVVHTLYNLARIANSKNDLSSLDELQARATEIASLDSGDWESWKWRGALHTELGQEKLAVAAYSRAIQVNNADVELRVFRGRSYQKLGELQLAKADFCKAVELAPERWNSWRERGLFYAKQNQPDKAQADIAMAVKLCPSDPNALNALSWSLATEVGNKPRIAQIAVDVAEKGLAAAPKDGSLWNTLGVAQYRSGDWRAAIEALEEAMQLRNGGDAFDWFFLAMAHWQLNNNDEAHEWYDKAAEWMDKAAPQNEELIRFRQEAAELLDVEVPKPTIDPKRQATSPTPQP